MINGSQIRMARGHLNWSVKQLSAASDVSVSTIKRMEGDEGTLRASGVNIQKIEQALDRQGIIFLDAGDTAHAPGICVFEPPATEDEMLSRREA